MNVVTEDLSDKGTRWIFTENTVYVDPEYIAEFKLEHPEFYSCTPSPRCRGRWTCHDIKLTLSVALIMVAIHTIFNFIVY